MSGLFISASEGNSLTHEEDVTQIHLSILKSHSITKSMKPFFLSKKEGTDLAPWQRIQISIVLILWFV